MDLWPVVDSMVQEMEWGEVVSTLEEALHDLWQDGAADPPPPVPAAPDSSPQLDRQASQGQYHHESPASSCSRGLSYRLATTAVEPVCVKLAPPPFTTTSRKRRLKDRPAQSQPHIKKPRNAFMLFLQEQRSKVSAEEGMRNSAAVNAAVGEKWKSLSREEQASYYEAAEKERQLHVQLHPGWSSADNYGKKRKRVRRAAVGT